MTVTTSIARHYAIKHVVLIVVSIVFALWGAYDLWIKLPREQRVADRFAELMEAKEQIEKDLESGSGVVSEERLREAAEQYEPMRSSLSYIVT